MRANKKTTQAQKLFADAIDYDALKKALKDKRVQNILKKIKY